MGLEGRHVVVTGGLGALGRVVVDAFLAAGARVTVPSMDARAPEGLPSGLRVVPGVDLGDAAAVQAFYERACADAGALWASVHVAGGFAMAPLVETAVEDWRRMFDLNATTAFLCTREAARRMGEGGRVVNVAAGVALDPASGAGKVAYTVSKVAVAALTRASAAELAPRGIHVNAVAPGTLDTPANRAAMPDADRTGWVSLPALAARIVGLCGVDNVESGVVDGLVSH